MPPPFNFYEPVATTTAATNASIDRVVFQIELLSGQINVLTYEVDGAVAEIAKRGEETISSISNNFNTDTIKNVERMLVSFSSQV
ncbi:unnamed protein product [Cylicostephanus goldi]|uniref:Uncharacterized protein n=1 Tax=Cylicostephanus goldi TaxID=71465 RepID=A0A3P6SS56_CYLGO|nr:unnamed protein product [Cylicostephanus goldi]